MRIAIALGAVAILLAGTAAAAEKEKEHDQGESKAELALKHRKDAPKDAEIDAAVTLDVLLQKQDKGAFKDGKAARIEGTLVQVEREEDGDIHLTLAPKGKETDTRSWVIAEVTPVWQKQEPALMLDALEARRGKTVTVTGWLYFEPDQGQGDPRGTMWEVHPVTGVR